MKILTVENKTYELDDIPDTIDDLRYSILDYSNPGHIDYYFIPLVFLESFYAPAAVIQIGEYSITMPLDWSIVICDPECGNPEVLSLMSLNDRGFSVFAFNPLTGFTPKYLDVNITNFTQNENGDITTIHTEENIDIETEFVIDCSGFARLCIGKLYKSKWKSYSEYLKVNSAIAYFVNSPKTS